MVLEAVKALQLCREDVPAIVKGGAARFVQVARRAYKQAGITFTDDELRNIYDGLCLVASQSAVGGR